MYYIKWFAFEILHQITPGIPVDVQAFVDGIDRYVLIASQIKNIKIHFEVEIGILFEAIASVYCIWIII